MKALFIRRDDHVEIVDLGTYFKSTIYRKYGYIVDGPHTCSLSDNYGFWTDEEEDQCPHFPYLKHRGICEASTEERCHGNTAYSGWNIGCFVIRQDLRDFTQEDLKVFTDYWDNKSIKYERM